MQTENRFFDDLARVAGGAFSTMTGLKAEMEAMFRQQLERMMGDMSMVSRDEFDAVREMAAKARAEQEALAVRVAELEAKLAAAAPASRRKSEKE
ncbi:MAG: accessory factor UbiK family protein [Alphaproteobacteria bacterium]|nr:accessory factor UbiK family protein [Alphaproteobacteria bacterium]MBF0372728.1 accessory factor UbiK family protein [Alphaproteobacteria bacterium]MBF0391627.1 accessory factor UbiK family protein [Alphaproteobacteria bacterium]